MGFKDSLVADIDVFLNEAELGEPITYNGTMITSIAEIGADDQRGNIVTNQGTSDRAFFYVKTSDVPTPKVHDKIVHISTGKAWSVARIASYDYGMYRLEVKAGGSPL